MKELLVLIPAYNEEESIKKTVNQLKSTYNDIDYIIVNDGSFDGTLNICKDNDFNYMNFPINLGLDCCVMAGMKYAYRNGYAYIMQYDADGQHLPEYIKTLYEKIKEGKDIVIGSRYYSGEKNSFSFRRIGGVLLSAAIKLTTGKKITDPTSGMRIYNRRCMEKFIKEINCGPEPDTISYLIKNGYSVDEVYVEMKERETGTSYLTLSKSIFYMVKMLISILLIQNFREKR